MKKLIVILVLLAGFSGMAQDRNVQGIILDGSFGDEPLAFANVSVKGIDLEAQTSMDGSFELTLLVGEYTLIVDFIGYEAIEIPNVVVEKEAVKLKPVILKALRPSMDVVTASNGE